eukprot:UN34576
MGFDAIWISPVPENTNCGYHGYWAYNLQNINPKYGTSSDLKNLVDAAHSLGMYVMVDIVGNHMGNIPDITKYPDFPSNDYFHSDCSIDYNNQNSIENCRLAGLPDLNSENAYVHR